MRSAQVKEIIGRGESEKVEFKESFHSTQDISKIICGLANTGGGLLILGVDDSGKVIGIDSDHDRFQQRISSANQNISPVPLISIELHRMKRKTICVVVVGRTSDNVFYTFDGAIFIKVGSTTRRLEGQTQLEFLRDKQVLLFDNTENADFGLEDIDSEKIERYLALRGLKDYLLTSSIQQFLQSTGLMTREGSLRNPAILFFSKDPSKYLPQSEIRVVKYSSDEPVDITSHRIIQNDVINAIEEVLGFVKEHIDRKIEIRGEGRRNEVFEYPLEVVREAIVNSITHRDYFRYEGIQISIFTNRIEITNPGSFPAGLTKELFGTISVQRNPRTYRLLRDAGYVEGPGSGIPRMRSAMRKASLREPEFLVTESFFRITLFNEKKNALHDIDLNQRQLKAIEYLKENDSITSKMYSKINDVSITTSVSDLNKMRDLGFLKKVGKYRNAYYIIHKSTQNR